MSINHSVHSSEIFPPVSVDISLGTDVSNFDVDLAAVGQHMMTEQGVSPDKIAETSVFFTARTSRLSSRVQGHYKPHVQQVTVGITRACRTETRGLYLDDSMGASALANEVLLHELQHRADDISGQLEKDDTNYAINNRLYKPVIETVSELVLSIAGINILIEKFTDADTIGYPTLTGIFAVSAVTLITSKFRNVYNKYCSHPSEIRARKHSDSYKDKDFVKVKFKKSAA